jgi:hypothetical protein
MLIFNKYRRPFFYDPNNGGPSGGGGNPAANQGGAPEGAGGETASDPFAGINLDDLDAATRGIVEAGRTQFAATQKQLEAEKKTREHNERLARDFQAKHDSLQAQLARIQNGGNPPPSPADAKQQALLADFEKKLVANGVSVEQAKLQAPLMLSMMESYGQSLKADIGRDFSPFAASVMQNEANAAWQEALLHDKLGALQDPAIAQQVWNDVQGMLTASQKVDVPTILNLRNIYYANHVEAGNQTTPPVQNTPPPQLPHYQRATFPGAGAAPMRPVAPDPNAARTTLDPATAAAINAVVSNWKPGVPNVTGRPNK